jgi:hypothetical protein
MPTLLLSVLAPSLVSLAAALPAVPPQDPAGARAAAAIDGSEMLRHIEVLASDEYEGRAPASRGEELTVGYLIEKFRDMGLKPGDRLDVYRDTAAFVADLN